MMTCIPTNILTLIKLIIVLHVLLQGLADGVVLIIIHNIRISDILGVNTTTALDQWKLLSIEILIRI